MYLLDPGELIPDSSLGLCSAKGIPGNDSNKRKETSFQINWFSHWRELSFGSLLSVCLHPSVLWPFPAIHCLLTNHSVVGRGKVLESKNFLWMLWLQAGSRRGAPICNGNFSFPFYPGRLQRTLPAGRSFIAMDTKDIPQILQQIFTSTMLSTV